MFGGAFFLKQILNIPIVVSHSTFASKRTPLPERSGRVEFRGVNFKYRSGTGDDVLRDIDLTIEPGQFVGLIGGTGTGKSTLINLIPRFYDVTGGGVLVDGRDVRDWPLEALRWARRHVSLTFKTCVP